MTACIHVILTSVQAQNIRSKITAMCVYWSTLLNLMKFHHYLGNNFFDNDINNL